MTRRLPPLETLVFAILAGGLVLSVALILAGLTWELIGQGTLNADHPALSAVNVRGLLESITTGSPEVGLTPLVLLYAGIAVLLMTPYVQVLAAMLFFLFRDRNYRFSAITGFVALVLTWVLFLR
jgi:uncharacterized membrane protein